MSERMYTESEVRAAFWRTFHRSGEIFFGYFGPDEDDENLTESEWQSFLENLHGDGVEFAIKKEG
jgi:hypothetical protein